MKRTRIVLTLAAVAMAAIAIMASSANAATIFTGLTDTDWNNASNWDNGLPTGSVAMAIQAGKTALNTSLTPATSTGSLTLNAGSVVQVPSNTGGTTESNVVTVASTIIFNGGTLNLSSTDAISFPAISMVGSGTLTANVSTGDSRTRNLNNGISGSGDLRIEGRNKQAWNVGTSNSSFSGDWDLAAIDRYAVYFNASGSAGTGDVTVTPRTDGRSATLILNANDVFDDGAILTLNGKGVAGSTGWIYPGTNIRIDMKTFNDTVGGLIIDSVALPAGAYTAASVAADPTLPQGWIYGTGILTVVPEPATMGLLAIGGLALLRRRRA